jgi:putative peptidoglycan lipid II flippase
VLVSRLLGLGRETVLAYQFGQDSLTTHFRAAFNVPDLISQVIAGGALSSVFIPVFADYWNQKREDEAWKTFGSILSIAAVVVAFLVVLGEVGVIPLTALLNRKFDADAVQETAQITRILLPVQWCLLTGGLMMGTLYARKRFLVPGLAPLFYNLGQIVGCLIGGHLYPHQARGIAFMAWGALIGAIIGSLVLPVWEIQRTGVQWRLGFALRHPGVMRVGQLMLPVILGQSLAQLNLWLTARFTGDDFRLSALTNAYNLTQAPIGIFAQAFGIVLLPTISALAAQKDWTGFREEISQGLRRVFFLTIPASVLMAALAYPLTRVFFKGGAFTEESVPVAAVSLVCYSLATFAWSGGSILQRGFWAVQDTKTPIFITTPLVLAFIGLSAVYSRLYPGGYAGYALITSLLGIISMSLFLLRLQKRVGGLNMRGIVVSALKIALASLLAGAVTYALSVPLQAYLPSDKLGSLLVVIIAGGAGVVVYALFAVILRISELQGIKALFRRRSTVPSDTPASAPE